MGEVGTDPPATILQPVIGNSVAGDDALSGQAIAERTEAHGQGRLIDHDMEPPEYYSDPPDERDHAEEGEQCDGAAVAEPDHENGDRQQNDCGQHPPGRPGP